MAAMAKLSALAVLIVAALALVSVAHATTTVTTVEESSENHFRGGGGMCHDQFRMANDLSHCQDMVMEMCGHGGCRGGRFRFGGRDAEFCSGGKCRGMMGEGSRHMRPCCQQLRMMDTECRCEGLREMMMEQMMEMGGQRDMEDMVRNLPSMCGMEPGMCHMGTMRRRRWD